MESLPSAHSATLFHYWPVPVGGGPEVDRQAVPHVLLKKKHWRSGWKRVGISEPPKSFKPWDFDELQGLGFRVQGSGFRV